MLPGGVRGTPPPPDGQGGGGGGGRLCGTLKIYSLEKLIFTFTKHIIKKDRFRGPLQKINSGTGLSAPIVHYGNYNTLYFL